MGGSHSWDEPGEKLVGPGAEVEAETELLRVALQVLTTQAMASSQEERLQIGDQSVYPARSAIALIKDLITVDIPLTQSDAENPEGIAADPAARTTIPHWLPLSGIAAGAP